MLIAELCTTLCNPMDVVCQASLSMEFSRQEFWSGWPFSSLGDLPDPGIEPQSPALQVDSSLSEPPGKPSVQRGGVKKASDGTSLTSQCLRVHLPMQGVHVHSLIRELRSHMPQCPKKLKKQRSNIVKNLVKTLKWSTLKKRGGGVFVFVFGN